MASAPNPLQPTWHGHISSTMDALLLFEACLDGHLTHVPRRPHDREREELIRSGNVFIYEEHSSGIKRWTDGYNWSPSRILGNFLIYRELEKAFPPGEKKKALKKNGHGAKPGCTNGSTGSPNGISKPTVKSSRATPTNFGAVAMSAAAAVALGAGSAAETQSDSQRALIGSLVDSYPFKEDGLVKKTISVHWNGIPHHLVSYYKVEDVTEGRLQPPSRDPQLASLTVRSGLISSQNFRVPVDQDEFAFCEDPTRSWASYYSTQLPPTPSGDLGLLPYRSLSMPNVQTHMAYPSSYHLPAPQIHPGYQMQPSVPSLANGHYTVHMPQHQQHHQQHHQHQHHHQQHAAQASSFGSFDPIRYSSQPRHSVSAPATSATYLQGPQIQHGELLENPATAAELDPLEDVGREQDRFKYPPSPENAKYPPPSYTNGNPPFWPPQ